MKTTQQTKYGVWIENRAGKPNGKWMMDPNNLGVPLSGTYEEAERHARKHRNVFSHLNYEVEPIPQEVDA